MVVNGWALLFHEAIIGQLEQLSKASARARKSDPEHFRFNANVKLFAALSKLILETIPTDPGGAKYRQGNTLGRKYAHWFRAKFFGRFRLFFRYDSRACIIVFAWVNDDRSLRKHGGKNDPYKVFRRMLDSGNPPSEWSALLRSSGDLPTGVHRPGASGENA